MARTTFLQVLGAASAAIGVLQAGIVRNYPLDVGSRESKLVPFKRRRLAAGEVDMVAVPEDFLKSASFICVEETDEETGVIRNVPKATAFMIAVPWEGTSTRVGYFVTARHCLYEARAEGHDTIYLRLNKKGEDDYEDIATKVDDWFTSDNDDVAVILFHGDYLKPGQMLTRDFEIVAFPVEQAVGPGPDYKLTVGNIDGWDLKEIQPREGNEIYFVGLFTQNYGRFRSLPVARFGHISRMPSLIEFEDPGHPRYQSIAYLAEFHSWGGHSGSPVYFWEPQTFIAYEVDGSGNATGRFRQDHGYVTGFLGLISHHYDIDKKAKVTGEIGTVQMALNSGIATIVPADAIRQMLIEREDVMQQRKDLLKRLTAKAPVPTADYASETPTASISKGEFEDALRRVSRRITRPSEPDSSESRT